MLPTLKPDKLVSGFRWPLLPAPRGTPGAVPPLLGLLRGTPQPSGRLRGWRRAGSRIGTRTDSSSGAGGATRRGQARVRPPPPEAAVGQLVTRRFVAVALRWRIGHGGLPLRRRFESC